MKTYCFAVIILLFSSCEPFDEMEQTVFIPDETDKNLPAYTEWGYNSFGAKYERMYFFSTNNIVPCKITVYNGMMTFSLSGRVNSSNTTYGGGESMTLYFTFPVNEPMNYYKDLMIFHQKHIDLTDTTCELRMMRGSNTEEITLLSGDLFFKRVQLLRINEQENRVILSGTFELTFLRNQLPEILSKGRFDVGISNLFVLP